MNNYIYLNYTYTYTQYIYKNIINITNNIRHNIYIIKRRYNIIIININVRMNRDK